MSKNDVDVVARSGLSKIGLVRISPGRGALPIKFSRNVHLCGYNVDVSRLAEERNCRMIQSIFLTRAPRVFGPNLRGTVFQHVGKV